MKNKEKLIKKWWNSDKIEIINLFNLLYQNLIKFLQYKRYVSIELKGYIRW